MSGWLQHNLQEIVTLLFGIVTLGILCYYFFLFIRFPIHKPRKIRNINSIPVSIVISARNEAHHLIKTLPQILTQQYLEYEVVVVNDNSTDETEQVVRDFMVQYSHLKLVNLTSSVTNIQGKKFPLSIGIKSASYDVLLLTDADSVPSSPYWLLNMAKHFRDRTRIVLGYSTYEKKKGFLNLFVHFETLQTALQYFSYTLAGMPYMGIGKNLAYTKSLFYERKGFASHNHIPYGDDDIFINRAATSTNCEIEYFKGAFTISRFKSGFGAWMRYKKRDMVTRRFYRLSHKLLLNTYSVLVFLFYLFFVIALILTLPSMLWVAVAGIFLVKMVSQYILFGIAARKLDEKAVIPFIMPFEFLRTLMTPFIYVSSLFSSYRKWK